MKKLFALTLALALSIALLAGCAGGSNDSAPADTADAATEPAEQPETDAEPTPEPETPAEDAEAPAEDAAEAGAVMTHDEYMAAELDSEVTVETCVQATQSWWEDAITVYAQSADGAYFIYNMACSEEDAAKLTPGTAIRVTGFKSEWSGEVEITDATFEFVDGGDSFVAEPTDVTELLGTDELIDHQNELVSFKGLTVESIAYKNDEPGDDIYVTLGYNGASYEFCVEVYLTGTDSEVYTTVGELAEGDVVDVEGFLYWYEGVNTHITSIAKAA